MKQRALVEDVKRSVAVAGTEQDKKIQIDAIMQERKTYADKVRFLLDSNRKAIRQLNEEIKPRLNSINNKIAQLENSKNVKLEVRGFKLILKKINLHSFSSSFFVQKTITCTKQ